MDRCPPPALDRNWADLGDGPTGLIAGCVLAYDVADHVRFRAVCSAWRRCSADPRAHGGLDRRFHPWRWTMLWEALDAPPDRRSFLNTSTAECVRVHIPELRDHELLALTPEGLLVLLHNPRCTTVRLLNPLTRHLTELPPLTTLLPPNDHDVLSQWYIHTYYPAWGSGIAIDGSTVVLCFHNLDVIGIAKPGDDHWTPLKYNAYALTTAPLMFKGRLYCFNSNGVMVLETGADQPPRLEVVVNRNMPISRIVDSMHLVNNFGELMLVQRLGQYAQGGKELSWRYNLYRVDLDTRTLFPVKSLGGAGRAMFMGMDCSLTVSLEVFPSGSFSADTIYLSLDVYERKVLKAGAYHLADGTTDPPYSLVPRPHTLADCLSLSTATRRPIPFP